MKKLVNPIHNGGAPFYASDFLNDQEESYKSYVASLQQYKKLSNEFVISGCEISSLNTTANTFVLSAGYVYLNDEVMKFDGYTGSYPVNIIEDTPVITSRTYKDVTYNNFFIERKAIASTSTPSFYIDFTPYTYKRIELLQRRNSKLLGEIFNYSGSLSNFTSTGLGINEYTGFALCTGSNGTPNLKGRFVVGYNPDDVEYNNVINKIGGTKTFTIDASKLPVTSPWSITQTPHNHKGRYGMVAWQPDHNGGNATNIGTGGYSGWQNTTTNTFLVQDEYANITQNTNAGGGNSIDNRPPYFALAFVQRIL